MTQIIVSFASQDSEVLLVPTFNYNVFSDNTSSCCYDALKSKNYNIVLATPMPKYLDNMLGFFGNKKGLYIIPFAEDTAEGGKQLARKFYDRLRADGVDPRSVTITRDGLNQIHKPELCANCGGVYDSMEAEIALISELELIGCKVNVIACD